MVRCTLIGSGVATRCTIVLLQSVQSGLDVFFRWAIHNLGYLAFGDYGPVLPYTANSWSWTPSCPVSATIRTNRPRMGAIR